MITFYLLYYAKAVVFYLLYYAKAIVVNILVTFLTLFIAE